MIPCYSPYWIGDAEVDKLIGRGEGWLDGHPLRDLIVRRYLKHRTGLANEALSRLSDVAVADPDPGGPDAESDFIPLADIRVDAVLRVLTESGSARVLDLGCGEGRLLEQLLTVPQFQEIVGVDVSVAALERAARRLRLERLRNGNAGESSSSKGR